MAKTATPKKPEKVATPPDETDYILYKDENGKVGDEMFRFSFHPAYQRPIELTCFWFDGTRSEADMEDYMAVDLGIWLIGRVKGADAEAAILKLLKSF